MFKTKIIAVVLMITACFSTFADVKRTGLQDREIWLKTALKIADPVLNAAADGNLKNTIPVLETREYRQKYVGLEAFARTVVGLSPWIELGKTNDAEGKLREKYAELIRKGLKNGVNPNSPDFFNFTDGDQPLCDASLLAIAIHNAPNELWNKLDDETRKNVIAAFKSTRTIKPWYNNWLMFRPMIELFLLEKGEVWDQSTVDFSLNKVTEWYIGDGWYKDGVEFHYDYYNSFVIQPFLLYVLDIFAKNGIKTYAELHEKVKRAASRHTVLLERMISPEGTYPPIGRSLTYRFGNFHLLSYMSLKQTLPASLKPAQVRCALTAVIDRMMKSPTNFDKNGILQIGTAGSQPSLKELYISHASVYYCCLAFLPLGLPSTDPFWADPYTEWTSLKMWNGEDITTDHAEDKIF